MIALKVARGAILAGCLLLGFVACTEFEQQVSFNPCDLRQLPANYECYTSDNTDCGINPETGAASVAPYYLRPKAGVTDYVTANVHAYRSGTASCTTSVVSGKNVPTLVGYSVFVDAPTPVLQLEAYMGHDERKIVRASFKSAVMGGGFPAAGALEWVLQAEDVNTLQWNDVASVLYPGNSGAVDWKLSTPFNGELSAYVAGNTRVRLELRWKHSGSTMVFISDARIFAPICVRSSTPPFECL